MVANTLETGLIQRDNIELTPKQFIFISLSLCLIEIILSLSGMTTYGILVILSLPSTIAYLIVKDYSIYDIDISERSETNHTWFVLYISIVVLAIGLTISPYVM